jgi:hypothetical protein
MSDTYVTLKIREALNAGQGSRAQAQRILIAWALDDEQLLRGLCKPFLKAIAASAVDRLARPTALQPALAPGQGIARSTKPTTGPKKLSPHMLDAIIARMGGGAGEAQAAQAGAEQADNLKTLAAAFHTRKKP